MKIFFKVLKMHQQPARVEQNDWFDLNAETFNNPFIRETIQEQIESRKTMEWFLAELNSPERNNAIRERKNLMDKIINSTFDKKQKDYFLNKIFKLTLLDLEWLAKIEAEFNKLMLH